MPDSSIKAQFQFESYKIDKINFEVQQTLDVLADRSMPEVTFQFSFRDAFRFHRNNKILYVTGIGINFDVIHETSKKQLAKCEMIMTGMFSANGQLEKEAEENLAKCQGPAILLPYARSAITSILTDAGFPTVIMPLVNVYEMAKNVNVKIQDRE